MSYKRSRAAFEDPDRTTPLHHAPYALYGTPLPAYDSEARDDGSYVPVWKQEVTDERGRKRLHGAFTGGFSAGYFNTVGSKEGWTPAAFVSSRTNRAKDVETHAQRAEDYMDDEDLAEQADSQKLETQSAFVGLGGGDPSSASHGVMFGDLFRATGETMGTKLLQKMGWRQGQGVGPKVRRRAKGDEKGEVHFFAPSNSRMITLVRKTDRKGLAFEGEGRLEEAVPAPGDDGHEDERDARILQTNRSKLLNKSKKTNKTGIGTGVLNDTGSDDEDPYAIGPQIKYNRIIGDNKKKKKKAGIVARTVNATISKPMGTSKKLSQRIAISNDFRKCHDGRLPLDGFVLALSILTIQENDYPPPTIPQGWIPSRTAGPVDPNTGYESLGDAAKASSLDPASRAALLGEQQLPGKSVFDFLSPIARDRLARASGKSNLPPGLSERVPAGFEATDADMRRSLWDLVPPLDKATAAAALHRGNTGWMPYAEDEHKRSRYRHFLELRAGLHTNLSPRATGVSNSEWAKELHEFAQAAEVFKPISGLMATRFMPSTVSPQLATDQPDAAPGRDKAVKEEEEDPATKAAKMGMFGPLTRSSMVFFPSRLLCKRFNVKPPANVAGDPAATKVVDGARRLDVVSQASIDRMMRETSFQHVAAVDDGGVAGAVAPVAKAEVDMEKNEALEQVRAGEAVFKAIFGSDDEDDE